MVDSVDSITCFSISFHFSAFFDSLVRRKSLATIAPLLSWKLWVWGHCRIRRKMLDLQLRRNVLWIFSAAVRGLLGLLRGVFSLIDMLVLFFFSLALFEWFLSWRLFLMLRVCACRRFRKLGDFLLLLNIWICIHTYIYIYVFSCQIRFSWY